MATPTWQHILQRAQQTLAVWQLHSPAFKVGALTLAVHQADTTALSPAGQTAADAQDAVDDARAARDTTQAAVASLNTRMPRKLDGDFLPDDPFHADLEDIRRVDSTNGGPAVLTRGQKVVALWKKVNARNAAASPVIPALTVGGVTLATFQAQVESLPGRDQMVEDKEALLRDQRGDLRRLGGKVDTNNKRWYAAWQGEFPAGTPEGDALSQITTESGGGEGTPGDPPPPPPPPAVPGAATLGSVEASGPDVTLTGMAAEGAETFDVEVRPMDGEFAAQATSVAGPDFIFGAPAAGDYEVRIAGRNPAGLGPWSDPAPFTV